MQTESGRKFMGFAGSTLAAVGPSMIARADAEIAWARRGLALGRELGGSSGG